VPGTEGGFVKIRDAVKATAPDDLPKPGAFKGAAAEPAAAEPVSEAVEDSNGGEA